MHNIRNIIFDYGNVIFMIDYSRTQHSFTELGIKNVEQFFSHKGHAPLFDEFEKGNITAAEFRIGLREITERPDLSDSQIDTAWNTLLIGVPPVNHDILLEAKKKYRTFLLSNINEIHYNAVMSHLEREHHIHSNSIFFEKVYYSHLVGMRKPDRNIFDLVLRENSLKPEETLFIDDSPQHIKMAEALGLHTYLMLPDDSLEKFMSPYL